MQAVRKSLHDINGSRRGKGFATVTQCGKDRRVAASDAFHVDFVARTFFHPKNKRRTGNILEAGVLHPKLVRPFPLDFNGGGHPQKVRTDQGQSGFMFKDRGLPLAFK